VDLNGRISPLHNIPHTGAEWRVVKVIVFLSDKTSPAPIIASDNIKHFPFKTKET